MTWAATIAGIMLAAATAGMQIRSTDFNPGGAMPKALMAAECGGKNRSPALYWGDAPKATKSFALILHDPDAPIAGGFNHWVVYNLSPKTTHLASGAAPSSGLLGATSAGQDGYFGPCPPRGATHHYLFTLYALDVATIASQPGLTAEQLVQKMEGHVLARATVEGTASTP